MKCEKNTESNNPKNVNTKKGRLMFLSKCEVCGSKKPRLMKKQEASGLLNILGTRTLLSHILLIVPLLF